MTFYGLLSDEQLRHLRDEEASEQVRIMNDGDKDSDDLEDLRDSRRRSDQIARELQRRGAQ